MDNYEVYEPQNQKRSFSYRQIIATLILAAANAVIFLILDIGGDTQDAQFMAYHGAMYTPFVIVYHQWYTLFTSMFLHFGISHLANNMLLLFGLGNYIERLMGTWKFVVLYLASGLAGNAASLLWDLHTADYAVSAGASGAIFGLMGGLLWIVIKNRGRVAGLTTRGLIIMIALSVYFGFSSAGIDNMAHLGGLACGFICGIILYRKKK